MWRIGAEAALAAPRKPVTHRYPATPQLLPGEPDGHLLRDRYLHAVRFRCDAGPGANFLVTYPAVCPRYLGIGPLPTRAIAEVPRTGTARDTGLASDDADTTRAG